MLRLCLFFAKNHLSVEPSWILDLVLNLVFYFLINYFHHKVFLL